ncbi:RHS repeat-associated core domain-containing protein [Lachnospiraceae bacterium MD335]|nr:RHS repeat-associated core domain-containing protein [Lachnospiraceae bacterium MD335]
MVSSKNFVSGAKSEYTYNGLLARVKKTSGTAASSYMPDYLGGIQNDLVTQISGVGTVNAVYGQGYGRVSQRFMPEAGTETADTYFQHDLYGSTLFAADAQGVIRHHAAHDIWGMPKTVCDDTGIASGLRFTTYDYDSVLGKHFAHARMYDPSQGRMLGIDPVKRGLNGYAYCDNDPANQTDPTGEVANVVIGGIAGAVIGGAFGFAGSALSQMAEGHGFNARKAWGAAANGAIVGAARGALIASGAGIPLAFGVDFAAGMAGSLAEQKITGARIAPVRAAVDGVFNAAGGRLYGTSPLKNAGNAFIRGALEGAVKGGAYNIADVLDNRLRNAYNARNRQKLRTTRRRNTWNKKNKNPWNSRNPRPTGSRSPQSHCGRPKPLKGMRNPKRRKSRNRIYRTRHILPDDRFRVKSFVRDVVAGAVMGGLASASFYGAGKAVEALKRGVTNTPAGLYLHQVDDSTRLNEMSIMKALRESGSVEGATTAKLIKRKKVVYVIKEAHFDGRGGSYFPHSRNIVLYRRVKLPTGEWRYQSAESAAAFLAHETKHWIDKKVLTKTDEFNAYMWQNAVLKPTNRFKVAEIWNVLNTHPAYKHLK